MNNSLFPNNGTSLSFKVAGLSIKVDGKDSFNPLKVQKDPRILSLTVAEAKTTKALLDQNNDDVTDY